MADRLFKLATAENNSMSAIARRILTAGIEREDAALKTRAAQA